MRIRGASVSPGYWNRASETRATFRLTTADARLTSYRFGTGAAEHLERALSVQEHSRLSAADRGDLRTEPLLLGHRPPEVIEALRQVLETGTSFGAPTEREIEMAELVRDDVNGLLFAHRDPDALAGPGRLSSIR